VSRESAKGRLTRSQTADYALDEVLEHLAGDSGKVLRPCILYARASVPVWGGGGQSGACKHSQQEQMAIIWRPYRTLPDGRVLWARDYGLRAWPIQVDDEDDRAPRDKDSLKG